MFDISDTDSYKKVQNNLGAFLTESGNIDKISQIKKQYFDDSSPTLNKVQGLVSIYTDYLFGNPAVQVCSVHFIKIKSIFVVFFLIQ